MVQILVNMTVRVMTKSVVIVVTANQDTPALIVKQVDTNENFTVLDYRKTLLS